MMRRIRRWCRRQQPVPGELETVFDVDWFSFDAVGGTEYKIATTLGTLTDSVIRLYNTDGITQLTFNDNAVGLESFLRWIAPSTGHSTSKCTAAWAASKLALTTCRFRRTTTATTP